jgi:hypothetical protein
MFEIVAFCNGLHWNDVTGKLNSIDMTLKSTGTGSINKIDHIINTSRSTSALFNEKNV